MQRLFSPWRLSYVSSHKPRGNVCVFCRAARRGTRPDTLVVHRGRHNFIILNKYPYNNGHLMIVPYAHLDTPAGSTAESLSEMMLFAVRCEKALRRLYRPTGINLGMNLGRSAGAGIAGHYHLHVVPRWDGDTNFMTVVHETRVIPESLRTTARRLRPILAAPGPRSTRDGARRVRAVARPARRRGR
jgi:ATP adenylyltransferase